MKALVAERDTSCREGISDALRRWDWEVVSTPLAPAVLQTGLEGVDVAIVGSQKREEGPVSVCRQVRELAGASPLYLIALVTSAHEAALREVVDAGADDCLLMPLQPGEIWTRLRTAARVIGLQEELVQARLDLHTRTTRDALTGLLNRAAIFDVLAGEVARCRREGTGFAVAVADIDHFKWVNDQYGHQ
ncbi:diguanylate cyclase, partial [bacterium]|nr:diguanylate cyclase [bacterium]